VKCGNLLKIFFNYPEVLS